MHANDIEALELKLIVSAIHERYGYDLRNYTPTFVRRRLLNALSKSRCAHLADLQHKIIHDPAYFLEMIEDMTIGVTEMFRDPDFFEAFRKSVVPLLRPYPLLKIWHGGCATGEQCLVVAANPMMNECVDCIDDDGCSGMLNRCAPNHTCVDCLVPADCGDGKDCTQDVCDGNVCSHRPLAAIDDGIDCTVDDCTGNGNITHVPTNSRCTDSDGRSYTVPTCTAMAPGTGCTEEPNHGPCMSTTDCFADFCLGASGAPVTGCSMESPCDGGTCNMGMCVP